MQPLPDKFVQQIRALLGKESDDFLNSIGQTPAVGVRVNPLKPAFPFADSMPIAWSSLGHELKERPLFVADPLFHAGAYYVQEASSMFLESVFTHVKSQLNIPLRVLDLCAAPGGKSTLLLSLMNNDDLLVANEIIKSRVNILEENIIRWGRSNVVVTNNDPAHFNSLKHYFDVIVVDAPCSGEGMFRKDKKAIEEWSEEHVKLCSIRQQRILADVLPALKPGGFLIYSTCTFNPSENEDNIQWLTNTFNLKTIKIPFSPESGIVETQHWKGLELYAYRFFMHKLNGEGFFIACLQKPQQSQSLSTKRKEYKFNQLPPQQIEAIKPWLNTNELSFYLYKQTILACPNSLINDMLFLQEGLTLRLSGLRVGELLKGKLVPNHQLALSVHLSQQVASIELDREDALRFLKRENFVVPASISQGIYLVKYQSIGLGWVKIMPNRINNYLPIHWRILKPLNDLIDYKLK